MMSVTVFILIILNTACWAQAAPHTEDYSYTYQTVGRKCDTYSYQSCSGAWFWRRCSTNYAQNCYNVIETVLKTITRCQAGWLEPECTTAICNPPCSGGKVCTAPPQTCECLRSGGGDCANVACSSALNCYPGTCSTSGSSCLCPSGFTGTNCESVTLRATVKACSVQISAGTPESVVASSDCVPDSIPPTVQWLATITPSSLRVSWRPEFSTQPMSLPRVNYVKNSPINVGIINSYFQVTFQNNILYTQSQQCAQNSYDVPFLFKDCEDSVTWSATGLTSQLTNDAQFSVVTVTQTGAQKTGDIAYTGGSFARTEMNGLTTRTITSFRLDIVTPTHCLLEKPTNDNDDCTCFPILVDRDMTTDAVINPLMCGWSDNTSGIAHYHVEVYFMQPGGDGTLEETRSPLYSEDIIPPQLSFRYTCVQSGVYSIQLTVYDRANNSASARKLFNYDGGSKWKVDDSSKVHIAEADQSTDYKWINNLVNPADGVYRLTLVWTGRYKTDAKYQDAWLRAAKPWSTSPGVPCTASNKCVDDIFDNRFGLRTISAISSNSTILLSYLVFYQTDSDGGLGLDVPPAQNATPVTTEQKTLAINASKFQNGDSVVVWFTASDFVGNTETIRLTVGFDRSRPDFTADEFATKTYDEYTSSLYIAVKDLQSGIKQINYTIYDVTLRQPIFSKTDPAITYKQQNINGTRKRAAEKQCPPGGDATCYCIPTGDCFAIRQYVNIENCVFDRYIQDTLEFKYTVTNQAGLSIEGVIRPTAEQLKVVRCRPDNPGVSTGGKIGIGIGIGIPCLLLLIVLALLIWHWRKYSDPLPARVRTAYNRTFRFRSTEQREAENPTYVPSNVHNRNVKKMNNVYNKSTNEMVNNEDEEYATATGANGLRVNARQVQTDRTLAEGKFAVLKRGTVTVNNECLPVAVKALKRGFTAADRTLMDQKISFLSGISAHVNIVKFIASYDGGVEGPIMLLELCDTPLKDWLSQNSAGPVDTLEEILNFVLDVATGVQHLHSRHIVHRRLAVRNVLLKRQTNGLVAKLIGFGPSAEDLDGGSGNEDVTRPVRWLAPETLDTMKSKNPTYNNKTDSWSFGITVWEMYSKGERPYPGNGTNEIKGLIARGHRMERPTDCPPELFTSVVVPCWDASAKKRPEFDSICSLIAKFRGSGQPEEYYAADQTDTQQELYCDAS